MKIFMVAIRSFGRWKVILLFYCNPDDLGDVKMSSCDGVYIVREDFISTWLITNGSVWQKKKGKKKESSTSIQ